MLRRGDYLTRNLPPRERPPELTEPGAAAPKPRRRPPQASPAPAPRDGADEMA